MLEGDDALMDQHREAIGGFCTGLLGKLEKRCLRGLVDRVIDPMFGLDAFGGKNGGVIGLETHGRGIHDQLALQAMPREIWRVETECDDHGVRLWLAEMLDELGELAL